MNWFTRKPRMTDPKTVIDRRKPCPRECGDCDGILKIERDELRVIVGEGIEKWLDKKFQQFGRWSIGAAVAGIFAWSMRGVFTGDWRILP
jgi:hypothetical protein